MKKKVTHMIRPDKAVTPNGYVQVYCATMYWDKSRQTVLKNDVTCRTCLAIMSQKKFARTKILSETQEG